MQEYLKKLKSKDEIYYQDITLNGENYTIIYLKNMIKSDILERFLQVINYREEKMSLLKRLPGLVKRLSPCNQKEIEKNIGSGNLIIIYKGHYYVSYLNNQPTRAISDSLLDPSNLLDSRDGFTEKIGDNLLLIKKRIKNSDCTFENTTIGTSSMSELCLIYKLEKNNSTVKNIKSTLENSKSKSVTSVNDLCRILNKLPLVPTFRMTSSPEVCCNAIENNNLVIILDNTPVAVIIPSSLSSFTNVKDEVNAPKYYTIFSRMFILVFFFLALFSLGLFIVVSSFHIEVLSPIIIANIQITERGTSFSLLVEILIVLIMFEFYRYISSRSPMNFVQNIVIIFGGLFIGTNAINAGVIGTISLIMTSLAYIAGFAVTNNPQLISSFSILRIFVIIASASLGLLGFVVSSLMVILFLANLNAYGTYYLEPFIPFDYQKIKKWFVPRKE